MQEHAPSMGRNTPAKQEFEGGCQARACLIEGFAIARRGHLLTLEVGDDRIHLDLEGRVHRAWLEGVSYQRGLDGRIRRVTLHPSDRGQRWLDIEVLEPASGEGILAQVIQGVAALSAAAVQQPSPLDQALRLPLEAASAWTLEAYRAAVARFHQVYAPIPILPPAQTRALVVQLTAGCSWNRCRFCHLYRDVSFRAKPLSELAVHLEGVLELVGRALPLRRGVFLGQANALVMDLTRLEPAMRLIRRRLPDERRWPFSSFIDAFTRVQSLAVLLRLRSLGLTEVALGLESGSAAVLAALGKPEDTEEAVALVQRLGEAQIRRGIIVLVGAGGHGLEARHVAETVEAISRMDLNEKDVVYLSPLRVIPGSAYALESDRQGFGILNGRALEAQAEALRMRLRAEGLGCPIALYDIRRFIY